MTIGSSVADILQPISGFVHPKARIEELFGLFAQDQAAVVVDNGAIVGVLTEIDLIDHLAKNQ